MIDTTARPDRHALLELDALLEQIEMLAADGDQARFHEDDRYRWVLHRLWIAAGNEALTYARLAGYSPQTEPWATLYLARNLLAHLRLTDIDDEEVWRSTVSRPTRLREQVRSALN